MSAAHSVGAQPCTHDGSNSRDRLVAQLLAALRPLAEAYPDDPGTSDLYNDQPVTVTLGDVRRAWAALAAARRAE